MVFEQNLLTTYDYLQIRNHPITVEIVSQLKEIVSICIYLFCQMQNYGARNAHTLSRAGFLYYQCIQYYFIR